MVEREESQQSTRPSKFIKIKTEKDELKKQAQELENIIMKNKAKGKPPAKQNKNIKYTSTVWAEDAYDYQIIDGKENKNNVVCGQCESVFNPLAFLGI